MGEGLAGLWCGLTALLAVASFYAAPILGRPSSEVTPWIAMALAGALGVPAMIGFIPPLWRPVQPGLRTLSSLFLFGVFVPLAGLSVVVQAFPTPGDPFARALTPADWGLAAIQIALPILLALHPSRGRLLAAVGAWCAVFGLADLTANILTAGGLLRASESVGGWGDQGYGLHWLGLPRSSFAEGLVATAGAYWSGAHLRAARGFAWLWFCGLLIALLASLVLIGSRAYELLAFAGVGLLILKWRGRWALAALIIVIATIGLGKTFTSQFTDRDDRLRADLILEGWDHAKASHWVVGEGVRYVESANLASTYDRLRDVGITESEALSLVIAYGWVAMVALILAVFIALFAGRQQVTWPAVLLAAMTGQLAFAGALTSLFGCVVFFTAFNWVLRDEPATL